MVSNEGDEKGPELAGASLQAKAQVHMSIISFQTLACLQYVAPKLRSRTIAAINAARYDRWSTRPGHVEYGGLNFVADTPALPVADAAFERVLDEEQRSGIRVRLERHRGNRHVIIDLAERYDWWFDWHRDFTLAATPDGDVCFVSTRNAGPIFEIANGNLQRRRGGDVDREQTLSLDAGQRFLALLVRGR